MSTTKSIKTTVEQLSVLYWLRLLDRMDVEGAETLGQKYFCLSLDSIGIEQEKFDKTVTELAEKGLLKESQDEEYYLAFTDIGITVTDILEKLDKLKVMKFKTVKEIHKFMIENKDDIIRILCAFGPTIIELITK